MCDSGVYYQASCISLEHWSFVFCFLVVSRIFSLFCFLVLDLQLNWKFCESVCLLNPAFLFLVCFVYICIFSFIMGKLSQLQCCVSSLIRFLLAGDWVFPSYIPRFIFSLHFALAFSVKETALLILECWWQTHASTSQETKSSAVPLEVQLLPVLKICVICMP